MNVKDLLRSLGSCGIIEGYLGILVGFLGILRSFLDFMGYLGIFGVAAWDSR